MASYFFDTSALVKYYHIEVGTPEVLQLLQEPNARHFISRLTVIEAPSAFAIKVRTGELAASNFHRLRQRFLAAPHQLSPTGGPHYDGNVSVDRLNQTPRDSYT